MGTGKLSRSAAESAAEDTHGIPPEMQFHAALLRQRMAIQREIERAARDGEEVQHAIDTATGVRRGLDVTTDGSTITTTAATTATAAAAGVIAEDEESGASLSTGSGGGDGGGLGDEEGGEGGEGVGKEPELKRSTLVISDPLRAKVSEESCAG